MRKTAILLSGTAYNFRYSLESIRDNMVIPNDADVFILTSRYNELKRSPSRGESIPLADDPDAWGKKANTVERASKPLIADDEAFIRDVFGERLKALVFIEDMPEYVYLLRSQRQKMMDVANSHREESIKLGLPLAFPHEHHNVDDGFISSVVNQYNNVKKCFELMVEHEEKTGEKYDVIARHRLDVIVPEEFLFSQYYLNHDAPFLFCLGGVDGSIEWVDEFCWFSRRIVADKLFPGLSRIGTIVDRRRNTIHPREGGAGDECNFSAETQFSLLLHELDIDIINVKIWRSARFTRGADGFDYINYELQWAEISIDYEYSLVCRCPSDINEHLPVLREYAEKCDHVTELGTRWGNSTVAFMAARPGKLVAIDPFYNDKIDYLKRIAKDSVINFHFVNKYSHNVDLADIEETDLLFIDTVHHAEQCKRELDLYPPKVRKFIAFHDTTTFWEVGEGGYPGLRYAIEPFMRENPEWKKVYRAYNNNGLLILERDHE